MLADHHNRYDFTQWDIFITIMFAVCVVVGVIVKRLLEDQDETA